MRDLEVHWLDRLAARVAPADRGHSHGDAISRRRVVTLGGAALAASLLGPLLKPPAVAWADCESNLFNCIHSYDAEGELLKIVVGQFTGPSITDKLEFALGVYVNLALSFAQAANKEYTHRSGCYDTWKQCAQNENGGGGSSGGGQPSVPVGSPYPPGGVPPQCGCVGGDTCCNCGPGALAYTCCIYGDCRCCG